MHPRLCSNDHLREAGRTSGTHIATAHRSTIARTPKLPTLLHYSAVAVTKSAAVSLNLGQIYASITPMALLGKRSRIRVAFYLDAVQDDMVRQLAKRADTTGADVIRAALTYGLPLVRKEVKEVDESGAQAAAAELEAAREWNARRNTACPISRRGGPWTKRAASWANVRKPTSRATRMAGCCTGIGARCVRMILCSSISNMSKSRNASTIQSSAAPKGTLAPGHAAAAVG